MTGVPDASASSATVGQASSSDGSTNASAAASYRAMVWLSTRPANVTWPSTPLARAMSFSSAAAARPADDQPRVRVCADDFAERLEQEALPRERMQALHVDQDVPLPDAERARARLRAGVVERELGRNRRIDD